MLETLVGDILNAIQDLNAALYRVYLASQDTSTCKPFNGWVFLDIAQIAQYSIRIVSIHAVISLGHEHDEMVAGDSESIAIFIHCATP